MKTKRISGTFEETADYQKKYESLLEICEKEGVMVSQNRVLEKDKDLAPHKFFRRGTREYIFPKRKVKLLTDNSHVIDPSEDYGLKSEEQIYGFNQDLVQGRIRIEYTDSDNRPVLEVMDLLGKSSVLPEKVEKRLEELF